MKKLLCFVFAVLLFSVSVSSADYSSKAKNVAFSASNNSSFNKRQLTKSLISSFDNDYEKLEAIAYWIASHISYDNYKYDGNVNLKEINYKYDVFKYRSGICSDFARLFKEMADIAGIKKVEYVSGYVIEADTIKKYYRLKDMPENGHAWNKVTLEDGRSFFVDTTFMSNGMLRDRSRRSSSFRHKMDVKKNVRSREVNKNVDDFYFDFTPKKEVKKRHQIHLSDKYVK